MNIIIQLKAGEEARFHFLKDDENVDEFIKNLFDKDIVTTTIQRRIGNKLYDLVIDDVGLHKEVKYLTAFDFFTRKGEVIEALAGDIVISKRINDKFAALNDKEVDEIIPFIVNAKEIFKVLNQCKEMNFYYKKYQLTLTSKSEILLYFK